MIFLKTTLSRRGLIRFASYMLALVAVLAAANFVYMKKLSRLENAVEAGYMNAVEELAQNADTISAVLTKGRFASTPEMMTRLSADLCGKASAAKASLEALPIYGRSVDNLEKFLSQVGNYAQSLSRRAAAGEKLSQSDREAVDRLSDCAEGLSESLWQLRSRLMSSDSSITELFSDLDGSLGSVVSDGFTGIEDGLKDMPKLIYDGPFSDHILERSPLMTENADEITKEAAAEKAALALGVDSYRVLSCEADEEGKMPSYCFYCEGGRCAVTKNGGYTVYCLKSRAVSDSTLTPEEGIEKADAYLKSLGISDMEKTYYESYNNVLTVNYAYNDSGITCYTDLIKVAVALDDGEIIGFDARGYLVNHHSRDFGDPKISEEDAEKTLSDALSLKSTKLAVIPTDAVEEKLCYELSCTADSGEEVLVYINAMTGGEEDILIILASENSVLTV